MVKQPVRAWDDIPPEDRATWHWTEPGGCRAAARPTVLQGKYSQCGSKDVLGTGFCRRHAVAQGLLPSAQEIHAAADASSIAEGMGEHSLDWVARLRTSGLRWPEIAEQLGRDTEKLKQAVRLLWEQAGSPGELRFPDYDRDRAAWDAAIAAWDAARDNAIDRWLADRVSDVSPLERELLASRKLVADWVERAEAAEASIAARVRKAEVQGEQEAAKRRAEYQREVAALRGTIADHTLTIERLRFRLAHVTPNTVTIEHAQMLQQQVSTLRSERDHYKHFVENYIKLITVPDDAGDGVTDEREEG